MKNTLGIATHRCIIGLAGTLAITLGACTGPAGRTSLVETTRVDPGPECALGGIRIDVGLDDNGNGSLDPGEVDRREHVCVVQADGRQSLVRVESIAAATDGPCGEAGGSRVLSGIDLDDDGTLGQAEVTATTTLCNGVDGAESLVAVDPLAPDPDGACFFGGVRVRVGLDDDGDGVLDAEEVDETADVCSLHVNENMTLVQQSVEPQGDNCPLGGIRWVVGYDADGDKELDPEEAGPPGFICNEMTVINGITTLLDMGTATGNQCAFGGHVLRSGPDRDNDGALDDDEVADVAVVCNGNDGVPTLVRMTPASGECQSGNGWTVTSGLDANGNGTLEAGEVQATGLVCSGRTGDAGLNSLIRQREAGNACGPRPGVMLEVGVDDNRNGTLDPGEVDSWDVVCDGYDGFDSLVWIEEDVNFCPYGGIRVETGLDLNTNDVLDEAEVDHFAFVCDGLDGLPSLVDVVEAGPDCGGFEGFYLLTGLDLDLDGFLDDPEVENSLLVCP